MTYSSSSLIALLNLISPAAMCPSLVRWSCGVHQQQKGHSLRDERRISCCDDACKEVVQPGCVRLRIPCKTQLPLLASCDASTQSCPTWCPGPGTPCIDIWSTVPCDISVQWISSSVINRYPGLHSYNRIGLLRAVLNVGLFAPHVRLRHSMQTCLSRPHDIYFWTTFNWAFCW
jgi:hypothetical protein